MYGRVALRDFGPFESAELEIKPLTLFIGRNSVGKSMLAYLLWTLSVLLPDPDELAKIVSERGFEDLAKRSMELVKRGLAPREELTKLINVFIEAFPWAIARSLSDALRRVYTSRLSELVKEGSERAIVEVAGPYASVRFVIEGEEVRVEDYKPFRGFLDSLAIEVPRPSALRITYSDDTMEFPLTSLSDLTNAALRILALYVATSFKPFFASEELVALLVDSRAGISRTLLKPYLSPSIAKGISYADEQFVRLYYRLAEKLAQGDIKLDFAKPFLEEIGCEPEIVYESGVYTIYVKTWIGKRLPFARAPSGARESVTLALALASLGEPLMIIVEEPEAHLHPRAQTLLARLVARAINSLGKIVVITTHSDYLVYSINNLISLSSKVDRARELGYCEDEAIAPEKVAAYLIEARRGRAVVEPLNVSKEGNPRTSSRR